MRKLPILSNDNTLFLLESDDFLAAFDRVQFQNRLDDFYFQNVGSKEDLNELWNVTKSVLIIFEISHGNARVESGFSVNNGTEKVLELIFCSLLLLLCLDISVKLTSNYFFEVSIVILFY